jgi:transcriptional regulator with XRE-family HTH domain
MTDRRERQHGSGFAVRLREVVTDYGSASTLAKIIDRSEGAVRKWLRGESEPNVTDLRALCEETHTSIDWLVTGLGPRQTSAGVQERPAAYQAAPRPLDQALLEKILAAVEDEAGRAGLSLPTPKRSTIVVMLYEQSQGRDEIDPDAVARLVQLAR